jgi:hypothetical protein
MVTMGSEVFSHRNNGTWSFESLGTMQFRVFNQGEQGDGEFQPMRKTGHRFLIN